MKRGGGYILDLSFHLAGEGSGSWQHCEKYMGTSEMRAKKHRNTDHDLVRKGGKVDFSQTWRCCDLHTDASPD